MRESIERVRQEWREISKGQLAEEVEVRQIWLARKFPETQ